MKRRLNPIPILFIAVFLFVISWYILTGIAVLTSIAIIKPAYIVFKVIISGCFIYALSRIKFKGMDRFFKLSTHVFMTFIVAEIGFSTILLLGDLIRIIAGVFGFSAHKGSFLPQRFELFSIMGLVFFILIILLFVDGIFRGKYAYRVIRHTLYFKNLPQSFNGFTIAQISDIHSGSFTNAKKVEKGIKLINAQKVDLFVFTGDLVNNRAEEILPWIPYFSKIKAPYGQFSILGNHDYGDYISWKNPQDKKDNLDNLKKYHNQLGFKLLLDEHVEIKIDREKIILAGVENWGVGFGERGDLQKALSGTKQEEFKILLSHDPSHWEAQVKKYPNPVQLTLSGHTHGMQFGIEAFGIKWSPVKYRYPHWAGLKKENDTYININRGFGFIGFSGRVGIWPEISLIELKKA